MKYNIEEINQELKEFNWKCISKEYKNLDSELTFQCEEGHEFVSTWKKIRDNRKCPICGNNEFKNQETKIIPKKKGDFRILALDQATFTSGFSIFNNRQLIRYGTFKAKGTEIERDIAVKNWIISLNEIWDFDYIGIEGIQYQPNEGVVTFQTLARLQGILMGACEELKIPYVVCPTNTWRHHCGVRGKTKTDKKRSMQLLVKDWYDVSVDNDSADAIGIGKFVSETVMPKNEFVF